MTSTPPPDGLAAVLEKVADALEECADSLDALARADRDTAARVLPALDRATRDDLDALDALDALARTDDQESENHHNGKTS